MARGTARRGRRTRQQRHAFRFKLEPSGKIITAWAKVIEPKSDVFLPLKSEHVKESMRQKGAGNTQTCSMAVCAQRESECFSHAVEGYIDWFYKRAFVVSKLNKNGLPSECYVYAHNDGIGQLNDTPGGQKKLLEELEAEGGERIIHLLVPPKSTGRNPKPHGWGKRDGKRSKTQPRGAKLRFAVAQMGAVSA